MKKNALFLAFIILASSMVGCQGSTLSSKEENLDGNITMSSKESFSSSSSDGALLIPDQDMATSADTNMPFELTEADLEEMREYARSFAEFFDTPFASPDELDYEEIGRNSLYWIIVDFGYDSFEKTDNGYPLVPKQLLQSYVWEHFGFLFPKIQISCPNIMRKRMHIASMREEAVLKPKFLSLKRVFLTEPPLISCNWNTRILKLGQQPKPFKCLILFLSFQLIQAILFKLFRQA